jgi:hypothetical protein
MSDRDREPNGVGYLAGTHRAPLRGVSSITITEPVGLLAPLLFADTELAESVDDQPSSLSTGPVTVAHSQSVAIPLDEPVDRSSATAMLRKLGMGLAFGGAKVLVIALAVLYGVGRPSPGRSASVPAPEADPSTASFTVPLPAQPTPPVAAAPGVAVEIATADTKPITNSNSSKSNTSSQTVVVLPRSSKGHRIFVDGRVVGAGPDPLTVKCGHHTVKIGSAGKPRIKDLPCGGEITLPPN